MRALPLTLLTLAALPFTLPPQLGIAGTEGSRRGSLESRSALLCGRVLDDTESPASEAIVFVLPEEGGIPIAGKLTDSTGNFTFSDLPPGRYVLLAIHGHHSPGRSGPVVIGKLGSAFPLKVRLGSGVLRL